MDNTFRTGTDVVQGGLSSTVTRKSTITFTFSFWKSKISLDYLYRDLQVSLPEWRQSQFQLPPELQHGPLRIYQMLSSSHLSNDLLYLWCIHPCQLHHEIVGNMTMVGMCLWGLLPNLCSYCSHSTPAEKLTMYECFVMSPHASEHVKDWFLCYCINRAVSNAVIIQCLIRYEYGNEWCIGKNLERGSQNLFHNTVIAFTWTDPEEL